MSYSISVVFTQQIKHSCLASAWKWMNLLQHASIQKKDDNKQIKDDKNDFDGIMGKSKQVAICAPS
jgi:hypothetical protein